MKTKHVVTGAFGLSGRYIARLLLEHGKNAETLTNTRPATDPFGGQVRAHPLNFSDAAALEHALEGAEVLYNTYWVRFDHKKFTHEKAVKNTFALFDAAKRSGVQRIVHTSITNPDAQSDLPYFRGKGEIEEYLQKLGISYSILRPAVLFGDNAILFNNIAWMLRRFPVFGVFGDGKYRIEPIHVEDFAKIAVEHGELTENIIADAKGPQSFEYRELIRTIGRAIGCERKIVSISPSMGFVFGRLFGALKGDVVITREEIRGLMAGLLATNSPPSPQAKIRLSEWCAENHETLGKHYQNELIRR